MKNKIPFSFEINSYVLNQLFLSMPESFRNFKLHENMNFNFSNFLYVSNLPSKA